MEEVIRELKV